MDATARRSHALPSRVARHGYDVDVTRTSYLRVYQPLASFPASERQAWSVEGRGEHAEEANAARSWLLRSSMPGADTWPTEGAFIRELDGRILVCPWRTRLRMLAGMLAFRGSIPEEVAEAFVPESQAQDAARELESMEITAPEVRSHIIHANWHVPLRWFAAFSDSERVLVEDRAGLRIRYEATLDDARARLTEAASILERSWVDEAVTAAVRELNEWLGEFTEDGILELDYGSVAGAFDDDELVDDRSGEAVWVCLEALRAGDVVKAGRIFGELSERWSAVRAREVVN